MASDNKKRIMILGASILQVPGILQAKEMGLDVIAVDMSPKAIGFNYADKKCIVSTIDTPAVLKAAKENDIDGIMTLASDSPMRTVAAVAKELNLISVSEETAFLSTNKAEMRRRFRERGVPVPDYYKACSHEEYSNVINNFSCSFIVKPADSSGSRGVYLVDDIRDHAAIEFAYTYAMRHSRSGEIVVEDYMNGPEVSVETLSVDGKCHVIQITDKLTTGAPRFVEMGHSQPTFLPTTVSERIRIVSADAVKAIGIVNGPSHTEIIVTEEGPKIVELGARLGGDCITTHLVPLSTGVNMVKCCIQIALGEKPEIFGNVRRGSAIRYFNSHKGLLKSIEGIEEAKNMTGVKEISFVKEVGSDILDINSSTDRMGYVICQDIDARDAIADCSAVMNKIRITIED